MVSSGGSWTIRNRGIRSDDVAIISHGDSDKWLIDSVMVGGVTCPTTDA